MCLLQKVLFSIAKESFVMFISKFPAACPTTLSPTTSSESSSETSSSTDGAASAVPGVGVSEELGATVATAQETPWTCKMCTLMNPSTALVCEVVTVDCR